MYPADTSITKTFLSFTDLSPKAIKTDSLMSYNKGDCSHNKSVLAEKVHPLKPQVIYS